MYLCDCVLDNLLVRHIALVSYKQLVDALGGVPVNLLQPLLDVVEAVHVGDVVDDADAVGAAVVGRCDGAETFLAGRVPLWSSQRAGSFLLPLRHAWAGLGKGYWARYAYDL